LTEKKNFLNLCDALHIPTCPISWLCCSLAFAFGVDCFFESCWGFLFWQGLSITRALP
jgi:hypothetical protein